MLQMIERGFMRSEIKLASPNSMGGKPESPGMPSSLANPDVQILRVGKFNHPRYGEFEITKLILMEMKANFDAKVRGVDIAFDYFHDSDKEASGWPTELYLLDEGNELWAKVDWTPSAQRKLQEREIRYFSPDFAFEWKDPETGVAYKNVLFGGGLTNRPFLKDMAAIVAAEEKEAMDLKELEKKVLKLAEDGEGMAKEHEQLKTELAEAKKKLAEYMAADAGEKPGDVADDKEPDADADDMPALKKKLAEVDGRNKQLEKELAEMKASKKLAEKDAAFTVLLSEGKAVAAQKKAFLEGDMSEFAKLAQPVNLQARGSSSDAGLTGDKEDRALKLAEEKMKADPKLSKIDAITLAMREVQ